MFDLTDRLTADVEPLLYKAVTTGESYTLGETLKESAGAVTKASGTDKPAYLCAGPVTAAGLLPVIPLLPTARFATKCAVKLAKSLIGSKVTLATDGLCATATTTGGVFRVATTDEADASLVTGYFD